MQYKSQSLIEHVRLAWRTRGILADSFVTVVPPQMRSGPAWYRGTADAVLQNLNLIDDFNPDVVAVFGSDHIYRMDVSPDARLPPGSRGRRHGGGAPGAAGGGLRVRRAGRGRPAPRGPSSQEKPARPSAMPDDAGQALVSMGNYLFSAAPLVDASLLDDARRSTDHDFGRSIIPELVPSRRVFAYDFQTNEVPGVKPYEEPGYWRDVGTIDAYWEAHMDLLGESPRFDLDNREWPIRTGQHPGPAARFIGGDVDNAQIAEGSLIKRATIRNSILGRSVWVNEGAVIEDSIVMDHTTVGKGARASTGDRGPLQHRPRRRRDRPRPRRRPPALARRSVRAGGRAAGRAPRVPAARLDEP